MGRTNDDDPYTGERYLDLDGRRTHRVILVTEKSKLPGLYKATVLANWDNPTTVGRQVRLSAHTLDFRYKHLR